MAGANQKQKPAKASQKIAFSRRGEAKGLDDFLQRVLPAPVPGYSRPLLGRALAEYALRSRALGSAAVAAAVLVILIPVQLVAVAWLSGADRAEFGFLLAAYFFTYALFACVTMAREERKKSSQRKRMRQLLSKDEFLAREKQRRSGQREVLVFMVVVAGIVIYLAYRLEPDKLLPSSIRAVAAFVWAFLLLYFCTLALRYILLNGAPQSVLVRLLASACGTLMIATPAQWRSVQYRRKAAAHLGTAAAVVEGAPLRILAAIPVPSRTPEWRQVRDSAAGLRRLAARVVTQGPDAVPEIERSLAMALATAVGGALVNLESGSLSEDEAAIASRLSRVLRGARTLVIALLPAIVVAAIIIGGDRFGWEWAREARPLLIQFAVVSLLIGLLSALDPSGYQQRLSAITGAGGSMFGRRG